MGTQVGNSFPVDRGVHPAGAGELGEGVWEAMVECTQACGPAFRGAARGGVGGTLEERRAKATVRAHRPCARGREGPPVAPLAVAIREIL
jgi:hypothetical protein